MPNKQRVLIRSEKSGVWFGELVYRRGSEVTLNNARKVWSWKGANTTSELSLRGPQSGSRIAEPVDGAIILGVCEVLVATPEAWDAACESGWAE
jgi:hypothetical protein